ncbi:MAG: substrate-binding domain-containing protein [Anaerolineae bacterium]|nr:substrate-binding domain-containing protein [Anaerolineae bacterium]
MNDKLNKYFITRRGFLRAGTGAAIAAAFARLLGTPERVLADVPRQTAFGAKRKIVWVPQAAGDWEVPVRVGFIDFCKMVGWEYQYLGNPVYSVENHLEQINNAISAKPDIIATQLENKGVVSGFTKAIDGKITMVVVNQSLAEETSKLGLNYIGEDGFTAGVQNGLQAASWAAKLTSKKEGVIVIGSGNPGAAAIDARQKGTEKGVDDYNKANGTNFTTEMFPDSGFDDITTAIQKYGSQIDQKGDKLVGLVGLGGPSGVAIWKTLKERNVAPGKYAAGCHDAFPDQLTSIEEGYCQWGIDQNLYLQGFMGATSAWYQLERGIPYRNFDTSGEVVQKADVSRVRARQDIYLAKAKEYGVGTQ